MEVLPLSDCEPVRDGLLLQPVNTSTALAYVAAGVWLLWRVRRSDRPWPLRAYAVGVILVGLGSVLFHGVGGAAARGTHDASIGLVAALGAVTGVHAWRHRRRAPGRALFTGAAALAVAAPFQVFGRTGGPLCAAGAIPSHGIWHVLTAVALAAAGAAADRATR